MFSGWREYVVEIYCSLHMARGQTLYTRSEGQTSDNNGDIRWVNFLPLLVSSGKCWKGGRWRRRLSQTTPFSSSLAHYQDLLLPGPLPLTWTPAPISMCIQLFLVTCSCKTWYSGGSHLAMQEVATLLQSWPCLRLLHPTKGKPNYFNEMTTVLVWDLAWPHYACPNLNRLVLFKSNSCYIKIFDPVPPT